MWLVVRERERESYIIRSLYQDAPLVRTPCYSGRPTNQDATFSLPLLLPTLPHQWWQLPLSRSSKAAALHSGPAFCPMHRSHTPVVANDNKRWGRGHYTGETLPLPTTRRSPPLPGYYRCACRHFNPTLTPGFVRGRSERVKVRTSRLRLREGETLAQCRQGER